MFSDARDEGSFHRRHLRRDFGALGDARHRVAERIAAAPGPGRGDDVHRHEEDQLFICWQGTFTVDLDGASPIVMKPGDVYVIRRHVKHKTSTDGLAYALMSIGVHNMAPG
jgi:mannose-6-phosphate isomerase-like protein (cupin superfamily)